MYEAHIYTLRTAVSADLSRSTSEMYLEKWEPWYLRWFSFIPPEENVYHEVAQYVARKNDLLQGNRVVIKKLHVRRKTLQDELTQREAAQKNAEKKIKELQKNIQKDLSILWPDIMHPYTLGYVDFMNNHTDEAQEYIVLHPEYQSLKEKQDYVETVKKEILLLKRKIAQLDKITRLGKLSRLLTFFEKFASNKEKQNYQKLLQCEKQPL